MITSTWRSWLRLALGICAALGPTAGRALAQSTETRRELLPIASRETDRLYDPREHREPDPDTERDTPATSEDSPVVLAFEDADITEVIREVARIAHVRFVFDQRVEGPITILSQQPVTPHEALALFTTALHMKGFAIVEGLTGELEIVPIEDAKRMPLSVLRPGAKLPERNVFATRVIPLQHLQADAAREALKELASADASLIADARSNTLIATDTAANLRRMIELVAAIDVPGTPGEIQIVSLQHAEAERTAAQLREMFAAEDGPVPASARPGAAPARFIADVRTNSVIAIAPRAVLADVHGVVQQLDEKRQTSGRLHTYAVRHADAEKLAKTLLGLAHGGTEHEAPPALEGGVQVNADPATNSLIVQASPHDYAALRELIERLDVRRPQVLVDVLLLEAQGSRGAELGTRVLQTAAGGAGVAPLPATASGAFTTTLSGGMRDVTDASGVTRSVPAIHAVIDALRDDADTEILSSPQILTADNEEARIVVGENRGFPVSQLQAVSPAAANALQTSTQIERRDVGVTIRVTPQITEDDIVRMKIFTELSHVTEPDNAFGPTTSRREIENTVYVSNGESVLIGGILSDRLQRDQRRVPVLGDLPWLGGAFRRNGQHVVKTNLVLLITPRIVRAPADMAQLTNKGRERFRDAVGPESRLSEAAEVDDPRSDPSPIVREAPQAEATPSSETPALPEEPSTPVPPPAPAASPAQTEPTAPPRPAAKHYAVEISGFADASAARTRLRALKRRGHHVELVEREGKRSPVLRLGPYSTEVAARRAARIAKQRGVSVRVLLGS